MSGDNLPAAYVDADACPVKDEVLKVAARHAMAVYYVSNAFMRLPDDPLVRRIVVPEGPDAADNWIAEHAGSHDVVITNDIPLARRCLDNRAIVLGASGREFTDAGIGEALAGREIGRHLREMGEIMGSGKVFSTKDRSTFLQAMESACRRARRGKADSSAG